MGRARRAPSRIVSIPSSDATFAQVVESILQRGTIGTEHDLETALHPLYPLATVRGRELSGERFATWYVYRDRTFRPPRDRSWWLSSVTARLELAAADGRILDATQALEGGLVDGVGDLRVGIELAKAAVGVTEARVVVYHRPSEMKENVYSAAPGLPAQVNLLAVDLGALASAGPRFMYLWAPGLGE